MYIPTSFGVLGQREIVNCPVMLGCFLGNCCASFVSNAEGHNLLCFFRKKCRGLNLLEIVVV